MRYLLLGGSGILGSGFVEAIGRRPGSDLQRVSPPWERPDEAARHVAAQVDALSRNQEPATVVWAAGIGQVGASRESMAAEGRVLDGLCDALTRLPSDQQRRTRLIFASSAGAIFGGNDGHGAITDATEPCPISDYGHEKLRQEQQCRSIAAPDGLAVLICRYSNLFGLASGRLPVRGLIPVAVSAARRRAPMTIYVSPDTRRDYVYGPDAAAAALSLADALFLGADLSGADMSGGVLPCGGPSGSGQSGADPWAAAPSGDCVVGGVTTALVARGGTATVAEILTAVGHIFGRRVPATFAVRPESALQPRTLMFSPRPSVAAISARTGLAVAIHRMVHAPTR